MNLNSNYPTETGPVDAARAATHELGNAAADGARQVAAVASREATQVGESAREWWRQQKHVVADAAGTVQTQAAVLGERSRSVVREQPLKSIFGALALGALIAGLFAVRRGR
jgi:ElaB/YqjD/DUF883 family membrane-anchored ribosome-binding protein